MGTSLADSMGTTVRKKVSLCFCRPLPRRMHKGQQPNCLLPDFVHQPITLMRNQFAGANNFAGPPQFGMFGEPCGGLAEKLVNPRCGTRVVGGNIVPDVSAVLLRLRCPNDSQTGPATEARRAANSASTASLVRPVPALIEIRAASTLLRKNES